MEEFCKKLPKIELHAHLNGSLSPTFLRKLGCLDASINEYQSLNDVTQPNSEMLNKVFNLFRVAHDATKTKESVYQATKSVIEEFHDDGVIYLELRTTPRKKADFTKEEYIETIIKAILDNDRDIIVKLLLSIDRRHPKEASEEALDLIIRMKNAYPNIIKGVDLCGNPNEGTFDPVLFSRAKENGLFLSLHCAEVKNDEEVLEMLRIGSHRIGHGTCIHPNFGGSKKVWDTYCKLKIPVECCLTSNIICGTSKSFTEHHVSEWIKNSLPFSLATDDKGVFATSLSQEYWLAHRHFNLNKEKLWQVSYDTIQQAFASLEEKKKLRKALEAWKAENAADFLTKRLLIV